jgi:peptide/nickel transport system permease protein
LQAPLLRLGGRPAFCEKYELMAALSFLNRIVMAAVTLFGVALIVFVLLRVVPGDPIAMMISPGASEADIAALRAHYGLDVSLPVQFGLWLKAMLAGDFGTSISLKRSVLALLGERLPATMELAAAALFVAVGLGAAFAVTGTLLRRTPLDPVIDGLNGVFLAVPDFVWALALVLAFGVFYPLFPLSGRIDPTIDMRFATPFYLIESLVRLQLGVFGDVLAHMVMPVLALALPLAAIVARILKAALSEAMLQDYIILARLKGMSELRLVLQEALRNAIGPTIALTGVQFTFLIGGTVIVERIFSYPGIGNMAIDAVINRDLPLIQGLVLVFGVLFILVNLLVDLLVAAFNPRLRHG